MAKRKHPMQKIAFDQNGTIRFVENKIVSFLLAQYEPGLNDLVVRFTVNDDPSDMADYEQLMMLIGYSVSGFGDLDRVVSNRTIYIADAKAERLYQDEMIKRLNPSEAN